MSYLQIPISLSNKACAYVASTLDREMLVKYIHGICIYLQPDNFIKDNLIKDNSSIKEDNN